ncbi:MAG: response regulator [Rhodobacteraceae bacterium]|nr:response regulator [Paracoccaceae bacterium]
MTAGLSEGAARPGILIVDDHLLIVDVIGNLLSASALFDVGTAASIDTAVAAISAHGPYDLVLLDYRLPGVVSLEGFDTVLRANAPGRVALLSGRIEKSVVLEAMRAGACGFIPKRLPAKGLISALSLMLAGTRFLPADFQDVEPQRPIDVGKVGADLTQSERFVLGHLLSGRTNKEIANAMQRAEVTVKMHVRQICQKLKADNRTHAAMIARNEGLM